MANRWFEKAISEGHINCLEYNKFVDPTSIGIGGFGEVTKYKWRDSGLTVALKCLRADTKIDESTIGNFIKELKLLQRVSNHSNVISFYGVTKDNNGYYNMILQYAENGTLREYLKENFTGLQWIDKLNIAKEIAFGLLFLHDNGIIHRDLHSKNILIHQRQPKIADFGLSKQTNEISKSSNSAIHGMTPYIEPKCFIDPKYKRNEKSDIYSFGVILWEISSGRPPFSSFKSRDLIVIHLFQGNREKPIEGTPPQYVELYKKCWDNDPDNRPEIKSIFDTLNDSIEISSQNNEISPSRQENINTLRNSSEITTSSLVGFSDIIPDMIDSNTPTSSPILPDIIPDMIVSNTPTSSPILPDTIPDMIDSNASTSFPILPDIIPDMIDSNTPTSSPILPDINTLVQDNFPENLRNTAILIVGSTGAGKSTLGNWLLDENLFETDSRMDPVTRVCQTTPIRIDDRDFVLIDTPDIFAVFNNAKCLSRIERLCTYGIQAIILVINIRDYHNFEETIRIIKIFFGNGITNHMIVAFSGVTKEQNEQNRIESRLNLPMKEFLKTVQNRWIISPNPDIFKSDDEVVKRSMTSVKDMILKFRNAYHLPYFNKARLQKYLFFLQIIFEFFIFVIVFIVFNIYYLGYYDKSWHTLWDKFISVML
ncbi:kinase-like domain-containing protein [Gigaspora rosea]|uniref:Kinase-like domain-containing protein n=1 Tax=Gigaspora rosea TaxID=44941 RepID=A0A397ULM7_9GLOM|nr:kinase-like domain-containing protein [Gigaspora rosea]